MDGEHVQLLRYQLNSLSGCWKPEDAGLPVNLAWSSPRLRFFDPPIDSNRDCPSTRLSSTLSSSSQPLVNPEAVSLIVSAFLQPVNSTCSTSQLRPYCPPEVLAPRDRLSPSQLDQPRQSLFPVSGLDFDQSTSISEFTGSDGTSVLTSSEGEALRETLKGIKSYPRRLFTPGKPHPNDIFFYKLTEKADIREEIKETMPSFGGRFGRLPPLYDARLREYKIRRRNTQRRNRVQAPPRRWI